MGEGRKGHAQGRIGGAGLESNILDRRTEEQTQPPVECQMREKREEDEKEKERQ